MSQTKSLGHDVDENRIKPNEEKVETILQLKPRENTEELKSYLGAIQYKAKLLPKLSERTDQLRKQMKKNEPWIWGDKQQREFGKKKQMLTAEPCLAHYAKDNENTVTTGASTTLWQKQDN